MSDVLFAHCAYGKRPEFRILTTIERHEGERRVFKRPASPAADRHFARFAEREQQVSTFVGDRATVVCGESHADGRRVYPFVAGQTLMGSIVNDLDDGHVDRAWARVERFLAWMHELPLVPHDVAREEAWREWLPGGLVGCAPHEPCLATGLLDLLADNVFEPEPSRYVLIDHELVVPAPLPVQYSVFRTLLYLLARIGPLLSIHGEHIPTRRGPGGVWLSPAAWDLSRWIDLARVEPLLALEETLQARFTGRHEPWPRVPLDGGAAGLLTVQAVRASREEAERHTEHLRRELAVRDERVARLSEMVLGHEAHIVHLRGEVESREARLRDLATTEVARLSEMVLGHEAHIVHLRGEVESREARLRDLATTEVARTAEGVRADALARLIESHVAFLVSPRDAIRQDQVPAGPAPGSRENIGAAELGLDAVNRRLEALESETRQLRTSTAGRLVSRFVRWLPPGSRRESLVRRLVGGDA